jgi:hypothetical protein
MFELRKKLEIRKLREEQKLIHELSKLAILVGATFLLAIFAWKLG